MFFGLLYERYVPRARVRGGALRPRCCYYIVALFQVFAACPQTLDKLDDEIHRHQARADSIFQIDEAVMGLNSCLCYVLLLCAQWHILILNLSVPYATLSVPYATSSVPYATVSVPYATLSVPYATVSVPYATVSVPYATSSVPYATSSVPYATLSVHLVCRSSGLQDLSSVNIQIVYGGTEMCNAELKCINLFAQ